MADLYKSTFWLLFDYLFDYTAYFYSELFNLSSNRNMKEKRISRIQSIEEFRLECKRNNKKKFMFPLKNPKRNKFIRTGYGSYDSLDGVDDFI